MIHSTLLGTLGTILGVLGIVGFGLTLYFGNLEGSGAQMAIRVFALMFFGAIIIGLVTVILNSI